MSVSPQAMAGMVHQFGLGTWMLPMAFLVSVLGSFVGLTCALIARDTTDQRSRLRWLGMASFAIGGVGIWLMHFLAMFGWTVTGTAVRINLPLTVVSLVPAVAGTFIALLIIGGQLRPIRIAVAGILLGAAVIGMHYIGAAAINISGHITYSTGLVILSVVIAVVAATAALVFTVVLGSTPMRWAGALVMGAAVSAMHYTGMLAMNVQVNPNAAIPSGSDEFNVLFPVFVIGTLLIGIPIVAIVLRPSGGIVSAVREPGRHEQSGAAQRDVVTIGRAG